MGIKLNKFVKVTCNTFNDGTYEILLNETHSEIVAKAMELYSMDKETSLIEKILFFQFGSRDVDADTIAVCVSVAYDLVKGASGRASFGSWETSMVPVRWGVWQRVKK